jgi:hypothetical protein
LVHLRQVPDRRPASGIAQRSLKARNCRLGTFLLADAAQASNNSYCLRGTDLGEAHRRINLEKYRMRAKSGCCLLAIFVMASPHLSAQDHSGAIVSDSINRTIYVTGVNYPQSPDIAVGIAKAYADLPSSGGTIAIPPSDSCYTMSTPVAFNTASKPVALDGMGGACINFVATDGTALAFNNGDLTNHFRSGGMRNIVLNGPNSGTSTGILLGGTHGAEGFYLVNSKVNWPAGTGITFGDNTWGTLFDHSTITGSPGIKFGKGTTNSGEDIELHDSFVEGQGGNFTNCAIFDGGSGLQLSIIGGSFDDCQLSILSGSAHVSGTHFENPGMRADSLSNPLITVAGNSTFDGVWLGQDASMGVTSPQEILVRGNAQVAIFGGSFTSNATVANLLTNEGSNVVYMSPGNVGGFSHHSSTMGAGRVSEFPVYGLPGIQACTQFSSGQKCNQFPPVAGTLSQLVVENCGMTSGVVQKCAQAAVSSPIIIFGEIQLNGSPSQSIKNLPFTGSSYSCSGSDVTSTSGVVSFHAFARDSVTISESGGTRADHLRYQCVGE